MPRKNPLHYFNTLPKGTWLVVATSQIGYRQTKVSLTSSIRLFFDRVLSDECELVSVWLRLTVIMQHKAAAIRQVQRRVEL